MRRLLYIRGKERRLKGTTRCDGKVENGDEEEEGFDFRLHCCIALRRSHMRRFSEKCNNQKRKRERERPPTHVNRVLSNSYIDENSGGNRWTQSHIIPVIDNSHSYSLYDLSFSSNSVALFDWPTPHSFAVFCVPCDCYRFDGPLR
jgi:hypothetical protein